MMVDGFLCGNHENYSLNKIDEKFDRLQVDIFARHVLQNN